MLNRYKHTLMLALVVGILLIPGVVTLPVIDRDEAHFAQATRQMLQTGQYFQIRFQEKTRFQKPPGINWLQAASVKLVSDADSNTIWPYRIPSLLSALLAVWFTYFFSRKMWGSGVAWMSSLLLASTLLFVVEGHMAVIDASLLASVALMQGALWVVYQSTRTGGGVAIRWVVLFWVAMAYGFLLKGVTPLVGGLTIAALCLVNRELRWVRQLYPLAGLVVFLGLTMLWLYGVNQAEHSNYLLELIKKDLLPKLVSGHESHGKPPFFHLISLPVTFWPASLFLWPAVMYGYHHRRDEKVMFLLAWIIPTWLFFDLMPTKLPQYVLPTFPAIAMLCALAIDQVRNQAKPGRLLHVLQALWWVLSLGIGVALLLMTLAVEKQLTVLAVSIALIISGVTGRAAWHAWRGEFLCAFRLTVVAALVSFPMIFAGLLPSLQPVWQSRNVVASLDGKVSITPESPLLAVGFGEPSLVFYLNTQNVAFTDEALARQSLKMAPLRWLLISSTSYDNFPNQEAYRVEHQIPGFNYNKGRWETLLLIRSK